jgi:hypothetical protein
MPHLCAVSNQCESPNDRSGVAKSPERRDPESGYCQNRSERSRTMLLFPTILVTSLATTSGWRLTLAEVAPIVRVDHAALSSLATLSSLRGCTALRGGLASHWALPCSPVQVEPLLASWSLGWGGFASPAHAAPASGSLGPGAGGFLHLDLLVAHHFGAGPEVGWIMPAAPHEDLLRQKLVTPGVGVWYSALASHLFLGISANTWISTLGETWFLNALSSEARVGFTL